MDYLARIKQLQTILDAIPCESLLITYPIHLLYLTGIELSAGQLLVLPDAAYLIVDGRYSEICQQLSPCPVLKLEDFSFKNWLQLHQIHQLAFESDKTTYHAFLNLQKIGEELPSDYPFSLLPLESPIQKMRMFKDAEEIAILREAARLGYEGYEFVVSQLKEGIAEQELALELEFFWKRKGAKKLAFDSIIAFGANSSMPHHRAGSTTLQMGMPVLIDIGVVWKHYHSDMTRVVFFGPPSSAMEKIYQVVEKAKQAALTLCRPGIPLKHLDQTARQVMIEEGYGDFFPHSLGHGLGLEIHEPPTIRSKGPFAEQLLEANQVITIEPGLYLPGLGGVRLEDTIVITQTGYENLTKLN